MILLISYHDDRAISGFALYAVESPFPFNYLNLEPPLGRLRLCAR